MKSNKTRLTSYQKLKLENKKLKQDIYNLIRNVDKIKGIETKLKYEMQYKLRDTVWFGKPTKKNKI